MNNNAPEELTSFAIGDDELLVEEGLEDDGVAVILTLVEYVAVEESLDECKAILDLLPNFIKLNKLFWYFVSCLVCAKFTTESLLPTIIGILLIG